MCRMGVQREGIDDDPLDGLVGIVGGKVRDPCTERSCERELHIVAVLFFVIVDDIVVVIDAACVKRRLFLIGTKPDIAVPVFERNGKKPPFGIHSRVELGGKSLECNLRNIRINLFFHA